MRIGLLKKPPKLGLAKSRKRSVPGENAVTTENAVQGIGHDLKPAIALSTAVELTYERTAFHRFNHEAVPAVLFSEAMLSSYSRVWKQTRSLLETRKDFMAKLLCLPLIFFASVAAMAQDWAQFRGPGGLGLSSAMNLPLQWSDDKNLLWKAKLPGRGSSSPILVGEKIFLTCWSGAVTKKSTAGLTRHLVCFDRAGKQLWQKDFPAPAKDFPLKGYTALHGYASSTPVSDGKTVVRLLRQQPRASLPSIVTGNQLWHVDVGAETNKWGTGGSRPSSIKTS